MNHVWQRVAVVMVFVFLFYFLFGAKKTLDLLLSLSNQKNIQRLYEATDSFTSSTRLYEDCSIEEDG
jgi:hypothetical protein